MWGEPGLLSRLLALAAGTALTAGGLGLVAPTAASAAGPSGGPTVAATCNEYTGTQDGLTVTDKFSGLIANSSAAYQVHFFFTDSAGPESFYDYEYWYADPDGTYNHVYTVHDAVPKGTAFTWRMDEYSGGGTDYDILDGSGGVGGPSCTAHLPKPAKPEITSKTLPVSKAGKLRVSVGVDANVTGTVHVLHSGAALATATYSSHAKTSVVVSLAVSKATLTHLKKIGTEAVKITATSKNSGGQVSAEVSGKLKAPPQKKKKK